MLAHHYCPQGNQPILQLVTGKDPENLVFEFLDGTNLQVPNAYHEQSFWIQLRGARSFDRGETYVRNGSSASEIAAIAPGKAITYVRIEAGHVHVGGVSRCEM